MAADEAAVRPSSLLPAWSAAGVTHRKAVLPATNALRVVQTD